MGLARRQEGADGPIEKEIWILPEAFLQLMICLSLQDQFVEGPINHKIFIKTFAVGLVVLHDPNTTITPIQIINCFTST